jgi:multidrug efflux pump subunit AcrA (membrane-fusion protein)
MASSRRFPLGLILGLVVVVGLGAWLVFGGLGRGADVDEPPLVAVARGPLPVTVLESGSLEALASTTIASPIEGQAAILSLVEEGTILTAEDVASGRVLVRLDSSELEEKIARQLIDLEAARASAVNAAASLAVMVRAESKIFHDMMLALPLAMSTIMVSPMARPKPSTKRSQRRGRRVAASDAPLETTSRYVVRTVPWFRTRSRKTPPAYPGSPGQSAPRLKVSRPL